MLKDLGLISCKLISDLWAHVKKFLKDTSKTNLESFSKQERKLLIQNNKETEL